MSQHLKWFCTLCLLLPAVSLAGEAFEVGAFSKADINDDLPAGWLPLNPGGLGRDTHYTLVEEEGIIVVRAVSDNAASGLIYPLRIDLKQYPVVQWRWKVSNVLDKGNALQKDGDDYPARLYITFDTEVDELSWFEKLKVESYHLLHGIYPPLAALNYLWANKLPVGTVLPNIYSARVKMFVVNSGETQLGEWVMQERNLYKDYVQAFGKAPTPVTGIAIMTDTDNTGEQAIAYYGDIRLLPASTNEVEAD